MMRKLLFSVLMFVPAILIAASAYDLNSKIGESYIDTGLQDSVRVVLNTTNITSVAIADGYKGFKLWPTTNSVMFSVNQDTPVSISTYNGSASSVTVVAADLKDGGIAKNDIWEKRLLPPYRLGTRTLYLLALTVGTTVDVELW